MCNLHQHLARRKKDDEYFTLRPDVAAEIMRHKHLLRGKRVHCPFSDYRYSQVVIFLVEFYYILGLAHLTATCIDNGEGAWRFDYDGKTATVSRLTQGGSFDTPEVTEIMHNSDVVIDNPPFSKFRAIIQWLFEAPSKKDIIMVNNKKVA